MTLDERIQVIEDEEQSAWGDANTLEWERRTESAEALGYDSIEQMESYAVHSAAFSAYINAGGMLCDWIASKERSK